MENKNPMNPSRGISDSTNDQETREYTKAIDKIAKYEEALKLRGIKLEDKERTALIWKLNTIERKNALDLLKAREEEFKKISLSEKIRTLDDLHHQGKEWSVIISGVMKHGLSVWTSGWKDSLSGIVDSISGAFKNIFSSKEVKEMMTTFGKYQEVINTRLQGTAQTFKDLQANLLTNVGTTPYIKTQNLLNNLQALVEHGIAFNLEQRAFLSTISEKIAPTFKAIDDTLNRLVRLQQQDTTASRLGMEAYMTRFLNNMFQDTQYLINEFDTVTANLTEAISQMPSDMGVEFEYVVQKWLGSLSSVGLSSGTVSNIAQAIGYLSSGNITGLETSSVQNLLVMAASRAGLDYGSIVGNLSLEDTNSLLKSVVEYLSEIGSTTNQVVKNQYAQTFGVTVSDLTAAKNIGESIGTIYDNLLSYVGSIEELQYQTSQIFSFGASSRTSIAGAIDNLTENFKFSFLSTLASDPVMSTIWRVADFVEGLTGGKLGTATKAALGFGSVLGSVPQIWNGVGNTFNFAKTLEKLGIGTGLITTQRGEGIGTRDSGFGASQSAYLGTKNGGAFDSGITQTLGQVTEEVPERTATDIYDYLSGTENYVKVKLSENEETEKNINLLQQIDRHIEAIIEKLGTGINVTVDNVSDFQRNIY